MANDENTNTQASPELYIHGKCHIDSPLEASLKGDILTINCFTCKKLILKLAVSPIKS